MLKGAIVCLCLLTGGITHAATLYVPDNHPTIQDAIDAAVNGDTIIVRQGTYVENIDFLGKAITVTSESGPDVTIIDGSRTGSVVAFQSGESQDSVLEGFTISNGSGTLLYSWSYCGGGILCLNGSSPTITGNTIAWNSDCSSGGGIYCDDSSPIIANNIIAKNTVANTGSGIYCNCSSALIANNIIAENTAVYIGGGIFCYGSPYPSIAGNTLVGNTVTDGHGRGGGICCSTMCHPTITDSIIWNNNAAIGPEIYVFYSSNPDITYCDIKGGWTGTGNINADPLFVTSPDGDYYLSQTAAGQGMDSPCMDAGSDSAHNLGMNSRTTRTDQIADRSLVDMGFHYESHSGPNLEITSMSFTPAALDPNSQITASYTIENKGNKPCGSISAIAFFLSSDENINLNDIWLGEDSVPDLNPGESYTKTDIPVNVGDNPGTWFFGGFADWKNFVPESNDDNGYPAGQITITSLWADAATLSSQTGGIVHFDLKPGIAYERRKYFLLGSMTGTFPGTTLPGGCVLPLNRDYFFDYVLKWFNYPTFTRFREFLDMSGEAQATLDIQPGEIPAQYIGAFLDFAFTTEEPYDFQSNPATVEIVP